MGWFSKGKREKETKTQAGATTQSMAGVKTAKDPVCGMEVNIEKAAASSLYQGQTYYFCSPGCKKAFDANPASYIKGTSQAMPGHSGHHM